MLLPVALSGVLSGILRYPVENDPVAFLVDHAVLAICTAWIPSGWVNIPFSLLFFLALAFYQTRSEFTRPEENDREEHGMCPVLSRKPGVSQTSSGASTPPGHPPLGARSTRFRDLSGSHDEPRELHGSPTLFPCDLRHKRIAPFQDAFRHAYLYCGVPVGLHACYSPILSVDQPMDTSSNWPFRKTWFSMRAEDQLIRGGAHMTMAQKLREFLLSEVSLRSASRYCMLADHGLALIPGSGSKRMGLRIFARSALCQRAGGQPIGLLVPLLGRQETHGHHSRAQHLVRGASSVACPPRIVTEVGFQQPVRLSGTVLQGHSRFSLHASHWLVHRGHF